jgi:hypothetical protein
MVVIDRLAEVTNDPILESTPPDDFVRVCGNDDRWNRVSRIDEMSVELNSGHSRHVNVGDQTRGCSEGRRCQEIGCRRERFNGVTQRCHELFHGFAKGLIILHDRYQCTCRHRGFQPDFSGPTMRPPSNASRLHAITNVGEGSRQSNAGGPKQWLMRSAFRLVESAVRFAAW